MRAGVGDRVLARPRRRPAHAPRRHRRRRAGGRRRRRGPRALPRQAGPARALVAAARRRPRVRGRGGGQERGALVALDAARASSSGRGSSAPVFSSPALAGDRVLVGSDDGCVHAVEPREGTSRLVRAEMGGKVRATPAVRGRRRGGGRLRRPRGRARAWPTAPGLDARSWGTPLYSSACARRRPRGRRLPRGAPARGCDLRDGRARFEVGDARPGRLVARWPRATASSRGSTDGEPLPRRRARAACWRAGSVAAGGVQSSPALDGDRVFVGSARGLHALRLAP